MLSRRHRIRMAGRVTTRAEEGALYREADAGAALGAPTNRQILGGCRGSSSPTSRQNRSSRPTPRRVGETPNPLGEAMSYPPLGTSVEQLAERLVAEVERILRRTGADKVHLVGHSLGGAVIAEAIADVV
jgi:pimeloyl-ACP methyl ester carboxylesterase